MSSKKYLISDQLYAFLSKFVTIGLPAIASLYAGLSAAWGDWGNTEAVVTTCAVLATFLGVMLKFAERSYDASDAKYDGELTITGNAENGGLPDQALTLYKDPVELAAQDKVVLKSTDLR